MSTRWQTMIILLIAGLVKSTLYSKYIKMNEYFLKPCKLFGGNISVTLGLSDYGTKADLKSAMGVNTSKLATNSNLAKLKDKIDKINIDKSVTVPVDLSKLK